MKFISTIAVLSVCSLFSVHAYADSPWMYAEGEQSFSITFVDDRFDNVWEGDVEAPIAEVTQNNIWLTHLYGLYDDVAIESKVGYTYTSWDKNDSEFDGFSDSFFSLKYQLLNEFVDNSIASLSIKITGILKGTYERASKGNPHAPGNKANGSEISLQFGKFLQENVALYADLGYRKLFDGVPDDILASAGLYYSINSKLGINGQYSLKSALTGTDIKDPQSGFDPDFFHLTKERRQWIELSTSYSLLPAHNISLGWAQVVNGRNTGKSRILYLTYQYSIY